MAQSYPLAFAKLINKSISFTNLNEKSLQGDYLINKNFIEEKEKVI